jgi:hypothetical protein
MLRNLALVTALSTTLAAGAAHADDDAPPPGPRNLGLMAAGLGVFAGTYTINAATAYAFGEGKLAIPVAGPVVYMATLDQHRGLDRGMTALLAMDAMVQAGGVVLAVVGAATRRPARLPAGLRVGASASSGGGSVALGGTF